MFFLFSKTVFAASNKAKQELPTRITADIIDIKRKSETMEFIGNVVVKKGADNMMSEHMTVFYDEDDNSKNNDSSAESTSQQTKKSSIKRIESDQHVKIFNANLVATGDSGYYDPRTEFFVLENNVVVNNGSSIGKGDKFIYNLKTQKGNFVGKEKQEVVAERKNNNKDNRIIFVISNDDLKNNKKGSKDKNKKSSDKKTNNNTEEELKKIEEENKTKVTNPNE